MYKVWLYSLMQPQPLLATANYCYHAATSSCYYYNSYLPPKIQRQACMTEEELELLPA